MGRVCPRHGHHGRPLNSVVSCHSMSADTHLTQIVQDMVALERHCVSGRFGPRLEGEHAADHKRLAAEAKSIIDAELGHLNDFSVGLIVSGTTETSILQTRKAIEGAINHIRRRSGFSRAAATGGAAAPPFISTVRLSELRHLPRTKWDFSRLIRLCEEVNISYANGCLMATAMLIRSITDHVPPIFGLRSFTEVANNYPGAQSFRASMKHLDQSLRNVADAHLHVQIRQSETLPTEPQVSFQADVDVLLSEIVRIGK